MKSKIQLTLIPFFTLLGLLWTQNLNQKNEETIFLTQESIAEYTHFNEHFSPSSLALLRINKALFNDNFLNLLEEVCEYKCHFLTPNEIPEELKSALPLVTPTHVGILLKSEDRLFLKSALKKLHQSYSHKDIGFSGVTFTNLLLDEYSFAIKSKLFPLLFLGVFILLFFFLRNILSALIIFIPGIATSSFSLVFIKATLGSTNLINSVIPLLLFIIQISLMLHIHFTALEFTSLTKALKEKRTPLFMMVFTTVTGFASLGLSDLKAIKEFGLLTSFLLILTTLITLLWCLAITHSHPVLYQKKKNTALIPQIIYQNLSHFWSLKKIIGFALFSILLGGYFLPLLRVITDATEYFPKEEQVRSQMILMAKEMIGSPLLEIIIDIDQKEYEDWTRQLLKVENSLKEDSRLKNFQWLSGNQLVLTANTIYTKEEKLPIHKLSYLTLKGQVPLGLGNDYPIENNYRLTMLGPPINVDEYEKILPIVEEHLKVLNLPFKFNGLYYHLMLAQKSMIKELFKSFLFSLIVISFLTFLIFKEARLFFIFLAVNLIPVFASFPLMYFFHLSLNIATVMTYSISLGLVVDSSFHIIHFLKKPQYSLDLFIKTVLYPIVGGSLLLALCFFTFSFSDFLPIREFGVSLSIVLLLGMIMDLKVLPTLYFLKK